MSKKVLLVVVLSLFIAGGPAFCQTPRSSDLLKRFDKNGDGKIDDEERRSVRAKMKEMQNKPGAMTPSGKTETIGNREVTEMEYASSDGRKIPCVLSMPQGDGPFPVLVTRRRCRHRRRLRFSGGKCHSNGSRRPTRLSISTHLCPARSPSESSCLPAWRIGRLCFWHFWTVDR